MKIFVMFQTNQLLANLGKETVGNPFSEKYYYFLFSSPGNSNYWLGTRLWTEDYLVCIWTKSQSELCIWWRSFLWCSYQLP